MVETRETRQRGETEEDERLQQYDRARDGEVSRRKKMKRTRKESNYLEQISRDGEGILNLLRFERKETKGKVRWIVGKKRSMMGERWRERWTENRVGGGVKCGY